MRSIRTIDELDQALVEDPVSVDQAFARVTIQDDIKDYLRHISEHHIDLKFNVHLRRRKGRSLGVHPSSACKKGVCALKIYYECTGEVAPRTNYDEQMQEIWDLGTMMHDRIQKILENIYGDQFEKEVLLSIPDLKLVGHTDGVFDFEKDGIRIVLEIKSIKEGGSFGWEKVQLKPMADNVRQAHFYMKAKNIPFGIILYIAKNTGEFKEHPVMFDSKVWADLEDTVAPVLDAINNGALVKATPGWHCKYCDFAYACKPGRKQTRGKGTAAWKRKAKGS